MALRDDALLLTGFVLALKPDAPAYIIAAIERIVASAPHPYAIVADTIGSKEIWVGREKDQSESFTVTGGEIGKSYDLSKIVDEPSKYEVNIDMSPEGIKAAAPIVLLTDPDGKKRLHRSIDVNSRPEFSPAFVEATKDLTGIEIPQNLVASAPPLTQPKNYGFGRPENPCDDCVDGACTMNCSPARDLKAPVSYFKDESACYDQPDETPKGDPVKKGRTSKLPDSLVDPIRSDIEGGVSVSALAKKHDVSYQGMRHFLDKHGIGTSDFWTEEKNAALWTMMQEGKTAGQVMEAVGAKSTVVVMRHYAYLKHQKYVAPAVASEVTSDIDAARKETSDTQTDLLELENSRPIKSGNF